MNGVLVINKEQTFTSFDVVAVVRKITGQKKIGHTGTLDPNATGVLPLLLGNATKAQDIIPNHNKTYIATFLLGKATDTLDIWGKTEFSEKTHFSKEDVEKVLCNFSGEILQTPPMVSAVQIGGKRLYDLARKGIEVHREKRKVTVFDISLLDFDSHTQEGKIKVSCSRGTYIRTLIDDIGYLLGTRAVMTSLNRTFACSFDIKDAYTLDEIRNATNIEELLLPTESLFYDYRYVKVSDKQAKRFSNGGSLDIDRTFLAKMDPKEDEKVRVKDGEGSFLGIGKVSKGSLDIFKLFPKL